MYKYNSDFKIRNSKYDKNDSNSIFNHTIDCDMCEFYFPDQEGLDKSKYKLVYEFKTNEKISYIHRDIDDSLIIPYIRCPYTSVKIIIEAKKGGMDEMDILDLDKLDELYKRDFCVKTKRYVLRTNIRFALLKRGTIV